MKIWHMAVTLMLAWALIGETGRACITNNSRETVQVKSRSASKSHDTLGLGLPPMKDATRAPMDHPGSFIVEELEARGWTQGDLAYILGMSKEQLNPILTGKNRITTDLAVALGDAFDMPPDFFANLQKLHDLENAKRPDPGIKKRSVWLSAEFPIREMIKRGWIEDSGPDLLELQMLRFLQKNRMEDVPFIGNGSITAHAAKKSNSYDKTTPTQYAWLHRVKKIADGMHVPKFSREKLIASLPKLRAHMQDKDDLIRVPEILADCGVRLVFVQSLPGAKIDGVCVWLDDQPAIGMSLRWNRFDNFCFVLRHECEHVICGHGKDESFTPVDEFDNSISLTDGPDEEVVANAAAQEFLMPKKHLDSLIARKGDYISERDVIALAARLEINPAIVVGQIQRRREKYNWLKKYQVGIQDAVLGWRYKDGWDHTAPTGL